MVPKHHCSAFTYDYSSLHPRLAETFCSPDTLSTLLPHPIHRLWCWLWDQHTHDKADRQPHLCYFPNLLGAPASGTRKLPPPGFPLWGKGRVTGAASE